MEQNTIFAATQNEFEQAFAALPHGGTIVLTSRITASTVRLPEHGRITVTSVYNGIDHRKSGACLAFDTSVTVTLGGETVWEHLLLDIATSGVIAANFHALTFGEDVQVNCDLAEEGNGLYLVGGENNAASESKVYEKDTHLVLHSGIVSRLVGFSRGCADRTHSGHAHFHVDGSAYVRYLVTGAMGDRATAGSASLHLGGNAVIEAIHMGGGKTENTLAGDMEITVDGGDIFRFDAVGLSAVQGKKKLLYDPRTAPDGLLFLAKLAQFDSIVSVCDINGHAYGETFANPFGGGLFAHTCTVCGRTEYCAEEPQTNVSVRFVADGGFGKGHSPFCPLGSYAEAIAELSDGGTLVLVGKCTLPVNLTDRFEKVADAFQEPLHNGEITVTCVHDGEDYRAKGASLHFPKTMDYRLSGAVRLENIRITAADAAVQNRIVARYNPITVGADCETPVRKNYKLDIIGGYLQFRYTDIEGCPIENPYEEIVNAHRPLPVDFAVDDPVPIGIYPKFSLRREATEAFDRMFADMESEGLKIPTVTDATRTYARQYALFTGYLCRLRRTFGYDHMTARKVVLRSCGLPTTSEHQYGVAVDMYDMDLTEFGSKKHHYFDITPEWAWVRENGPRYGIVLRYPDNKTDITGCIYEAWHFRYVGKTVATVLKARGYTLEEYMGAKLGLFHRDAHVTVESGNFHSITAFSRETGLLQFTGKHFLTIGKNVRLTKHIEEASEC